MKQWLFILICLLIFFSCAKQGSPSKENSDTCDVSIIDTVAPQFGRIKAIDLGLSVLWADRNLGASEPADCGGYYPALKAQDTIKAIMGDGWRLPTAKEMEELFHETDRWTGALIDSKGIHINGKQLISKKNGNDIFFPSAGVMKGCLNIDYGTSGVYTTSTHTFSGQYSKGMWGGFWDDAQEGLVIPFHEITSLDHSPEWKYTIRPVKDR